MHLSHSVRSACFLIAVIVVFPPVLSAQSDVEIGGVCNDPSETYYYAREITKSPWGIDRLYAVPAGTLNPQEWQHSEAFEQQLLSIVGSSRTPQSMASACGQIWGEYFSDTADIVVNLKRTISTTYDILECNSGHWSVQSTETQEQVDDSGWLAIGNQPWNVHEEGSISGLQSALEEKLSNLNSQPGAASVTN